MPKRVRLRPVKPPQFADMPDDEYVGKLDADIASRCRDHRKNIRRSGRRFMGVSAVRKQNWRDRPTTPAPRRVRHPHLAAKDPEVRKDAIKRRADFLSAHRKALALLRRRPVRKGDIVFPCGTWQMRLRHQIRCHPPPDTW